MAEAFNMRPFGFNVMPKGGQTDSSSSGYVVQRTVGRAIESLWEPVENYLNKNEDVFNGTVGHKIERTNFQTMQLGTIMNQGKPIRNLDTKF
jgi:hypothetical protein